MSGRTLDLRERCARAACNKLIGKGKMAQAEFQRYQPYCSYHCQQWGGLEAARAGLAMLKARSA